MVAFACRILDETRQPIAALRLQIWSVEKEPQLLKQGKTGKDGFLRNISIADDAKFKQVQLKVFEPDGKKLVHDSGATDIGAIPRPWTLTLSRKDTGTDTPDGGEDGPEPDPDEETGTPKKVLSTEEHFRQRLTLPKVIAAKERRAAGPLISERVASKRKGRALGRRLLGQKPRKGGAGQGHFVPAGKDPAERLVKDRQEGIRRLNGMLPRARGMRIYERDLDRFELGSNGTFGLQQKKELFDTAFMLKGRGDPLSALLQECQTRHAVKRFKDEAEGGALPALSAARSSANEAATGGADTALGDAAGHDLVARLDGILGSAPQLGLRATPQSLGENLGMTIPSGPADAEAYYDYHALQVAWSDTWTALVDPSLESRMAELYDSIVDVVDPETVDADLSEISELHDLLDNLADMVSATSATLSPAGAVPPDIQAWMPEFAGVWSYLQPSEQEYVRVQMEAEKFVFFSLGGVMFKFLFLDEIDQFEDYPDGYVPHERIRDLREGSADYFRVRAAGMLALAEERREEEQQTYDTQAAARLGRAERLIGELKEELVKPYQFDVFAPGAYNFGVLSTYRQRWRPLNYQAGDLAGAIPLAPNEKRSYTLTRKRTTKTTRSRDRESQVGGLNERTAASRAEAEIAAAVQRNTSASANTSGSGSLFGVVEVSAGAEFGASQDQSSNKVKKELREATSKASQDYRDSNKVAISFEETLETSYTESREIQNPNNELTVTYLFYELQRRYEVSERLHDVTPVVLVAYEVPKPHEITEAWLLKHDWIIRKALLDDSYLPSLTYLSQTFAGDEVSVEILEQQWKTQLAVVADLRMQGRAHQNLRDQARSAVEDAVEEVAQATAGQEYVRGGIGRSYGERLYAAEGALAEGDAQNARQSLDWADEDLARIEAQAREAITALERATEAYVGAVEKRLNRRVQIDRLILHVKENILHYMQAIWNHEHPDQRYLRLYDMDIDWPDEDGARFRPRRLADMPFSEILAPGFLGDVDARAGQAGFAKVEPVGFADSRKLHQVADLRKPLGYRGNLAMFPLTELNDLVLLMAEDFLDSQFGIMDPDPLAELPTASEALEIARCAWNADGVTEATRREIAEWLMKALREAHRISQEITIPTGEVFIEALPGKHPILEDYKLAHRAHDAALAGVQVKQAEVELLRRAMRLRDGDYSDADVDKYIRIDGEADRITINTDE